MFDLTALRQAAELIGRHVPPTPQYNWPLLSQRLGCEVWVKHENHTPAGAFKVRGGLLYVHELLGREPRLPGMISATRGNHGISLAMAARQVGVPLKVLVPQGNSTEKNAAMRACGAEVIEHGEDFDTARQQAAELARQSGWHFVPALHPSGSYPDGLPWPSDPQWGNFAAAFTAANMERLLLSSFLIVLCVVPISLLFSAIGVAGTMVFGESGLAAARFGEAAAVDWSIGGNYPIMIGMAIGVVVYAIFHLVDRNKVLANTEIDEEHADHLPPADAEVDTREGGRA